MAEQVDVCVVGGGVIGMFCALDMARAGKSVRLIDKVYTGASRHNIGELLLQGHSDAAMPFIQYTYDAWQEAAKNYGEDLGFQQRGSVFLAFENTGAERFQKEVARDEKLGLKSRLCDNLPKLAEELGMSGFPERIKAVKVSEGDAAIDTGMVLDHLRKLLIQNGVRIWGSDAVESFVTDGSAVRGAKTAGGDVCEADQTFVCAGAWSGKILSKLNLSMPVRPARGHLLRLIPHGRMPSQMVAHREEGGDVIIKTERSGHAVVAYQGLMDQAQATFSTATDEPLVEWLKDIAGDMLRPLYHARVHSTDVITLGVTPDSLPYLGPVPGHEGLMVAVGFNGKTYAWAAGVAKVLGKLARGEEADIDMSPFNPLRFVKS